MDNSPLSGLRVLDLTRLLPGPFLSLTLADLGASVIKVEPPGSGDWVRWLPPLHGGLSSQFIALNRGKRSMVLNLKTPDGVKVLKTLCKQADVLLESFRPGVMERLGVGYDELSRVNEGLVYVALTGYGQNGPYRDRAGHDLNYVALGGALGLTGEQNGDPVMAGFQTADISGGLYGVIGALSAIYARQNTGKGRFVDVSLTESALSFNVLTMAQSYNDGVPVERGSDRLAGGAACYQVYACKDGGYFSVGALEPKFFQGFCDAVGKPEWKSRHMGDDAALKQDIAALFSTKSRDEWEHIFSSHDVCCEPVLNLEEMPSHPLFVERNVFFTMHQPNSDKPYNAVKTPLMTETSNISPAPALGGHTREVLGEHGYTLEAIEVLINNGTVA